MLGRSCRRIAGNVRSGWFHRSASSSHTHTIIGIHLKHRLDTVPEVQQVLSKYGNFITTRLGLRHDSGYHGLILLDIRDHKKEADALIADIEKLGNCTVKSMFFPHPEHMHDAFPEDERD